LPNFKGLTFLYHSAGASQLQEWPAIGLKMRTTCAEHDIARTSRHSVRQLTAGLRDGLARFGAGQRDQSPNDDDLFGHEFRAGLDQVTGREFSA
jgi:hypothetical protein